MAICFGINLPDIFKIGIQYDKRNLAMDNDDDDDDDDVKDLYVICYTLISLITHHSF